MSNSIAPLPAEMGVAAMTDHHQRRDPNDHLTRDGRQADERDSVADATRRQEAADAPPPALEEEPVPAETLFATTLLADAFVRMPPSPQELKLRTSQEWTPPESPLHLADKLI